MFDQKNYLEYQATSDIAFSSDLKLTEFKELMAGKGTQKTPKGCVSDVCCQNFKLKGF